MGRNESMESTQSLWHNRRIQRSAAFALFLLTLLLVGLYSRRNWPDVTDLNVKNLSDLKTHSPPSGPPQQPADEPLHNGKVSEYDTEKMPEKPSPIVSDKQPEASTAAGLDPKRVALIMETRSNPTLPAVLSQFISILPESWVVRFVGTDEAFEPVLKSFALARHLKSGKLVLTDLPTEYPIDSQERVSATLTDLSFYADFLAPAEWILMFQTDSMICSGSEESMDDWVAKGYDWVGAPWSQDGWGGNGGLSLRHVPSIIRLLEKETRIAEDLWEDRWLCDRLNNTAPSEVSRKFSVESIYYERPMGYHLRGSGRLVDPKIWANPERKRQIFRYCPEIKVVLGNMNLAPATDVEDEQKENDAKQSAAAAVFEAVATKMMDPKAQPTLTSEAEQSVAAKKPAVTVDTAAAKKPAVTAETAAAKKPAVTAESSTTSVKKVGPYDPTSTAESSSIKKVGPYDPTVTPEDSTTVPAAAKTADPSPPAVETDQWADVR